MGTLKTWTVLDLGCDGSQYFPGDTAMFSPFDVAEVGVDPDASAFAELNHSECGEDHAGDDWNHYVSIRYTLEP